MSLAVYLFAVGWPLAMAFALLFEAARPVLWRMMPLAALPALMLGLLVTEPQFVEGTWFVLGLTMGLDQVSRLFLIFTATLWIAAGSAARHWMRDDPRATGFGVLFLMAMSGNLGLILSKDAMAFYGAFALMSFASYGLVLHNRDAGAQWAARLYIGFVVIGELILFSGLVLAATQSGSILLADMRTAELSGLTVALLLVGFGIKLGVMPLHFWLPPAHGAAPVPASAVLSGAMIKAGLFGILSAVPLGVMAYGDHGTIVMAAGMVTIFAGLLLGAQERSAKTVLGYSSVSQMGIVALGLGAGLMVPAAWPALLPVLVFLAAHHALAKGALFLGVGAWAAQRGTVGRIVLGVALLGPALVLAGVPFSSGALGKEALKSALALGSEVWRPWLTLALTLSGIATTLLMARAFAMLGLNPPKAPQSKPEALALPFLTLAGLAAALPLIWPVLDAGLAAPVLATGPGALWPVALGISVALAVAIYAHAQKIGPRVFLAGITAPVRALSARMGSLWAAKRRAARRLGASVPRMLEHHAGQWRLGQTALAGLMAAVLVIEAASSLRGADDKTPAVLRLAPVQEPELETPDLMMRRQMEDEDAPRDDLSD
ncbi:MAG: complex I subunit 5 family protein [Paracoccus sp. (in: a-proteobacteria)]|nr:complex I subunit 5 family protein [Paracoccus sp. (in: a-proteobacteria)]